MHFKNVCRALLMVSVLSGAMNAKAQNLVWSDEFNQTKLDAEKWTTEVGGSGFGNGELQYYTSGESNVFIGSKYDALDTGYLVIEARRENYGVSPENRQFTSGRIHTSGKFNFKYGTVEARIKLPDLQNGLWPAFWMLGANYPTVGWPRSGEIDILEAGFRDDWQNGVANQKTNSTVHWFQDNYLTLVPNAHELGWWGNASATNDTTITGSFNDGFHLFKLTWTPTEMRAYVDGIHYYTFAIPESDANITEFNYPFYFIMNLAVGGSNFVGITDPNQITAPMPAQMQVDYVRVYSNDSTEIFQSAALPRETGTFGVFTETTSVTNSLGEAPTIEVWNNLAEASSGAQEGSNVLAFTANPGNWFGFGIPTGTGNVKNMQNFIDGNLHFHMKTSSTWPMSIGVISTSNGNAQPSTQSKSVRLDPAGNQYGLVRDGEWHEVIIPLSAFGNIEFRSMNNMFYLVGDNPTSAVTFAIDNIYWADGTKITPENGDYVIYADNHAGVDTFNLGTDGQFFIWEATLNTQATTPAEGSNVLSFTHNNKGWFGAAFTASAMHNLTAFQNEDAKLVFSLKTSDTTTPFHIGMKSGTRDGEGQKWIAFETAQTPYGFQRNGTWQVVEIPMSDFYDAVNLMEVTQMFQILGVGNVSDIAIDNIYLTGGGTALPDVGSNALPVVNAGANATVRPPSDTVTLVGSATDSDGTIATYAWSVQSGPNAPALTGDSTTNVTATGLVNGTYIFKLTATDDDGGAGYDLVTVFVGENIAPVANAGADKTISLPADSVIIVGSGSDADGTITTYSWIAESGPNTPTLIGSTTNTLSASDLIEGTYEFIFTVGDNEGGSHSDVVTVVVTANTPPTANAGDDRTITLPTNSITINGSGTDTGSISGYAWSQSTGPNTATLSNQNTAALTASNLVAGSYVFMLTVTDNGGLTDIDSVNVTVYEAPVNIALLKTVQVSSVENGTTPGSYAVDGNFGSRWSSAFSDPQWLYVDLGDSYTINTVKITWEPAYGKDYQVQISDDASAWTTVKTISGNTSLVNEHTGFSDTARFVRIYGTARATPYGYSIYELEIFGTANDTPDAPIANAGNDQTIALPTTSATLYGSASDADGSVVSYEWSVVSGPTTPSLSGAHTATLTASDLSVGTYVFKLEVTDNDSLSDSDEVTVTVNARTNLALQKPVLFSSAESDGTLGANAVDGNLGTRWASAFFDPQWLYVDLGQTYAIDEVKIFWEGAFAKDYQLQVSDDASNWTTIKTIEENNSTLNVHTDLSGSGRYLRFYGTERATPWGYSFWELEVYGGINQAPAAHAGSNKTIHLPDSIFVLEGYGTDANGSIETYNWTLQSGPSTPTLLNSDTDTLTVVGVTSGNYVFRLTVTDNNGASAYDDVEVLVNARPTVNVGSDRELTLPVDSVMIEGTATDSDGTVVSYTWTVQSGPSELELMNASTSSVIATGFTNGIYVLRLTVEDNLGGVGYDDLTIAVSAPQAANLALFKTVNVSSTANESAPGSLAVDGEVSTRWISGSGDTQWLFVDLGDTYTLDSVRVLWGPTYGKNYLIQISTNGTSWTTMRSVSNNRKLDNRHTGLTGAGRYVRIYCTARGTIYTYSIAELEVYGTPNALPVVDAGPDQTITLPTNTATLNGSASDPAGYINSYLWTVKSGPNSPVLTGADSASLTANGLIAGTYVFKLTATDNVGLSSSDEVTLVVNPAPLENLALAKPTTVSSTAGPGTPGSNAVDGNMSSAWTSSRATTGWIYVDLGATYVLKRVSITWNTAYAYNYLVQVSSTGTTWETVKTIRGNTALVNNHTVSGTGRYVRIYCMAPGTSLGYSISELEIYGVLPASRFDTNAIAEETAEDEIQIECYPNPARDIVHVNGLKDGTLVRVISSTGSMQYDKTVMNASIDIIDIPAGLYILDCMNGVRKKIIKE